MSRVAGEQIVVRPTNNVYTALAGIALLATIIALVAVYFHAADIGGLF